MRENEGEMLSFATESVRKVTISLEEKRKICSQQCIHFHWGINALFSVVSGMKVINLGFFIAS